MWNKLATTVLLACAVLLWTQEGARAEFGSKDILRSVTEIEVTPESKKRVERISNLANELKRLPSRSPISDSAIDAISSLLSDRDRQVRGWAAIALSYVGPRGMRAMPRLLKALSEAEGIRDKSAIEKAVISEYPICFSIARIGGTSAIPTSCRDVLGPDVLQVQPTRYARVIVNEREIPALIDALKSFAKERHFDFSSEEGQGLRHETFNVSVWVDRKTYFSVSRTDEAAQCKLAVYSTDGDPSLWLPRWNELHAFLSAKFGRRSVEDEAGVER